MPYTPSDFRLKEIKKALAIPRKETSFDSQILTIIRSTHFERLSTIARQIGMERKGLLAKSFRGTQLTERQEAILDISKVVQLVRAEYYKDLANYSRLFAAFNFLEDAVRSVVNEQYSIHYKRSDWHKDTTLWPEWFLEEVDRDQNRKSALLSKRYASGFLESISFGPLLCFMYNSIGWNDMKIDRLFSSPKDTSLNPITDRCELGRKLAALQSIRNIVFHHKVISRVKYKFEGELFSLNSSPQDAINRVAEILRYFDVDMEYLSTLINIGDKKHSD